MNCTECRSEGTIQCIACLRERLRETAQILIEAVGADGPLDAEDAARRVVAKLEIAEREKQNAFDAHAKLSNLVDFPYVGQWTELVRIIEERLLGTGGQVETSCETCAQLRVQMETLRMEPTDILVVRVAFGDMDPMSRQATMTSMYVGFRDWLRERKVPNAGVIVLPQDHDIEKIPRDQLLVLLDGDRAARVERATEEIYQKHLSHSSFTGMKKMARTLAEDALAAADGEHVFAEEKGS